MDLTTNYKFKKATLGDPASILDFMSNFDDIDALIKAINDTLLTKAGNTAYVVDANINNLLEDKSYICAGTITNAPVANTYCFVRAFDTGSTNRVLQICSVPQTDNTVRIFTRAITGGATYGIWREFSTTKYVDEQIDVLEMLIHENTFRSQALAGAMTKSLTTLFIQTFTDITAIDSTKGDGAAAIANYYKAATHIWDKTDEGTVTFYTVSKVVSSGNNNAWAVADWENVDGGSVELAISRNNGTTYTVLTNDTLTSISGQTAGLNMILRITLTGKLRLKNLAWGVKA